MDACMHMLQALFAINVPLRDFEKIFDIFMIIFLNSNPRFWEVFRQKQQVANVATPSTDIL